MGVTSTMTMVFLLQVGNASSLSHSEMPSLLREVENSNNPINFHDNAATLSDIISSNSPAVSFSKNPTFSDLVLDQEDMEIQALIDSEEKLLDIELDKARSDRNWTRD